MVELFGNDVNQGALARYTADSGQVLGLEVLTVADGAGRGVRILEGRTGALTFRVAIDRGFDLLGMNHRGVPIGWQSATGVQNPALHAPELEDGLDKAHHVHGVHGVVERNLLHGVQQVQRQGVVDREVILQVGLHPIARHMVGAGVIDHARVHQLIEQLPREYGQFGLLAARGVGGVDQLVEHLEWLLEGVLATLQHAQHGAVVNAKTAGQGLGA